MWIIPGLGRSTVLLVKSDNTELINQHKPRMVNVLGCKYDPIHPSLHPPLHHKILPYGTSHLGKPAGSWCWATPCDLLCHVTCWQTPCQQRLDVGFAYFGFLSLASSLSLPWAPGLVFWRMTGMWCRVESPQSPQGKPVTISRQQAIPSHVSEPSREQKNHPTELSTKYKPTDSWAKFMLIVLSDWVVGGV